VSKTHSPDLKSRTGGVTVHWCHDTNGSEVYEGECNESQLRIVQVNPWPQEAR